MLQERVEQLLFRVAREAHGEKPRQPFVPIVPPEVDGNPEVAKVLAAEVLGVQGPLFNVLEYRDTKAVLGTLYYRLLSGIGFGN